MFTSIEERFTMQFIKRLSIYLLLILLFVSIYKDLTIDTTKIKSKSKITQFTDASEISNIRLRVEPGDTVISIVEEVNKDNHISIINITQIISDFEKINPDVDPYELKPNNFYYFPLYHHNT